MIRRSRSLVLVAVLLAGCSSSGRSSSRDATVRRAPGAPLDAGYVVPAGGRLVGPVFSVPSRSGPRSLALIDVERDPLGVYDAFVAQARRLGTPLPGSGASPPYGGPATCHLVVGDHWAPVGPSDAAAATSLACYGAGLLPEGNGSIVVQTTWGGSGHHVLLEIAANPIAGGTNDDLGSARAPNLASLPKVVDRAPVSELGAPFGSSNNGFEAGYRRFTLEAGSRVVADVDGLIDGTYVVLRLDGDARQVMTRYARQIGADGTRPPIRERPTPEGGVLTVENSPEGGGAVSLVTDPSGRWLLIRASSD